MTAADMAVFDDCIIKDALFGEWAWPRGELSAVAARLGRSAPGPDGVPCQLWGLGANQALPKYAVMTVCGQQRGFVPGRSILDDVVELEGSMLEHSMAVGTLLGGLFLDSSAFPSLAHSWLFKVPRSMNFPIAYFDKCWPEIATFTRSRPNGGL